MEARNDVAPPRTGSLPTWALGAIPLALIAAAIGLFAALGGPGLGDRKGPPVEELAVERTVLRPGKIEMTVRNDGPDPVTVSQIAINDAYFPFDSTSPTVDRLRSAKITVPYNWVEGEAYEIFMLTSTGATIDHEIAVAVETPEQDAGFLGLMALLGIYVGVIPVSLGLLWLPFVRRLEQRWMRTVMAFTVGLLLFLAVDAALEGLDVAGSGAQALGGAGLVALGAILAYVLLAAIDVYVHDRADRAGAGGRGAHLALLVAVGIGLHNLGEGLAIGSAYSIGALALGASLVIGFAIHNTTEGLAIVAPIASQRPSVGRLALLGLIAGSPAILGAWIGSASLNPSMVALMLGVGVGAIAQVIGQLVPTMRDSRGRALHPAAVAGLAGGVLVMYATGLLVSV